MHQEAPHSQNRPECPPLFTQSSSTALTTEWIEPCDLRNVFRKAHRLWPQHTDSTDPRSLSNISHEIWLWERGIQSVPQVCILHNEGGMVDGILCGYPRSGHQDFFIQHIVLHPALCEEEGTSHAAASKLLEAAMDESVSNGWFGWVSCSPDESDVPFWRNLGFSKHDDFTFRRMGYFH